MICTIETIKHVRHVLKRIEKTGELIWSNGVFGNATEINRQFSDVHSLKPNIKDKSGYSSISFHPDDIKLNVGQLNEIAEEYAKQFGFDNNQYVVYLHEDKAHRYLTVVFNRIGYDRKLLNLPFSYYKNIEFSRKTEKQYNLIPTNSRVKGKVFTRESKYNDRLKLNIDECLKKSKNLDELAKNLKEQYSITMYKGRGVSFMYQEKDSKTVKVSGSSIGREYSLNGLERQINNN